jgi:hypothetical protein
MGAIITAALSTRDAYQGWRGCLWAGGLIVTSKGADQLFETKLIVNPHAKFPLSGWISKALAEIGNEFKKITQA